MSSHKKGDLVYIPSSVTLYQFGDKSPEEEGEWIPTVARPVKRHRTTEKPRNVVVIEGRHSTYTQVLYDSEKWYVKAKDIFSIGERQC